MKPKLFNEEEVLKVVFEVFWEHGFDGTSIQMLQKATGLSRSSIYHSFEDKNKLFRSALTHYLAKIAQEYYDCLNESVSFIEGFERLLAHMTQVNRHPSGCLLVLSSLELEQHEVETRELIKSAHETMRRMLINRLQLAQERGEISSDIKNIQALAETLYVFINGFLVVNKVNFLPSEDVLNLIKKLLGEGYVGTLENLRK